MFEIKGQQALKDGEMPMPTVTPEGDQHSSYGTGESEEDGALEIQTKVAGNPWSDTMGDIKRCIAAVDASQKAIVDKLAKLEKLVTGVQDDVTWVRSDVGAVHDIVDNLADHVSMFKNTVAVVEGLPKQLSPDVSAWGQWGAKSLALERAVADSMDIAEDDMAQLGEEEPKLVNAGYGPQSAIEETQLFDMNTAMPAIPTSQGEEDGSEGWFPKAGTSRGYESPIRYQNVGADEEETQDIGSHQMELAFQCTQTGTQAPGPSMWSDRTTTVTDNQSPGYVGGHNSPGCVRSKRARASSSGVGHLDITDTRAEELAHHGDLNLNLSPDRTGATEDSQGMRGNDARPARGPGSRGGGRGGGRSGGRGKRPPPVQPRYHTTASDLNTTLLHFCSVSVYICIFVGLS
jgi:hypothetical protein